MRIAVDVDGVLADHFVPFAERYREETGFELRRNDLNTWDVPLPESEDDATLLDAVISGLGEPEYLRRAPLVPGARRGVSRLRDRGHEIVIATHRQSETHPVTREWLDRKGVTYDEYVSDVPDDKGSLDADLLIDDYHGNVRDALDAGSHGLLMLQPWNRLYTGGFDHRRIVDSWERVPDAVAAASAEPESDRVESE